jgi:hypothetical protein
MTRTVKTFLVWMLMLLLPLHAVAASVGMSCAPVRQHQPAADAHAQHGGAHADHHAAQAASATDEHHAPTPDIAKKVHASCSACSALCAGAVAPPSSFLPLPTFDGSEALIVSSPNFLTGFIPDGPQRPPRRHAA